VNRLAFALLLAFATVALPATAQALDPSRLDTGDLVFQRSKSAQARAIEEVTRSPWGHVGVVLVLDGRRMVLEAVQPVRLTPLGKWIARSRGGMWTVRRLRDANALLTPSARADLLRLGRAWLGRPYDLRFAWDDERLYCSELVWKLFERALGVRLGEPQDWSELNLTGRAARQLLRRRLAGRRPKGLVVTPAGLLGAPQLVAVE